MNKRKIPVSTRPGFNLVLYKVEHTCFSKVGDRTYGKKSYRTVSTMERASFNIGRQSLRSLLNGAKVYDVGRVG